MRPTALFLTVAFLISALCQAASGSAGMPQQPSWSGSPAGKTAVGERPNIVFIYTDDQAPWALGASGNFQALTPNMDRLAREGAYLANSFVPTPVCSPARASLMTSRYGTELGILDFIPNPEHRLYTPDTVELGLDPSLTTWVEVLANAGYATGLIGKWHLGDWTQRNDRKFHPTNHGFDWFMGLTGGGTTPDNPLLEREGLLRQYNGLTTDILADEAVQFITRNRRQRFLLCLHHRAPHAQWLPVSDEDWAPYRDLDAEIPNPDFPDLDVEKVKTMMREYLASVRGVDRNLGRVLQALDDFNLAENTVVIFTSDHGYNMGHNGIWHKGNGIWATKTLPPSTRNIDSKYRPNLYDNSLRVPALVRWPAAIRPGSVVLETISSLDWYPTLVAIAGAELPAEEIIRGRNFLPLLTGERVPGWENDLYAEYSMVNYCRTHLRMYRSSRWKLIRDFLNPERDELYDLMNDPAESENLIGGSSPEILDLIRSFDAKILEKMRFINDPILEKLSSMKGT